MADFSISRAIGSGFDLIVRRPGSVLAWSAAYLLIALVPVACVFGYMFSELPSLFAGIRHLDPQGGPPPDFFRLQSRMMMANPIMFVTGLAGRALLVGAIYRSILEPDNRRFFALRLGTQELWLALSLFVYGVMMMFAIFGVMLGGGALGGLVWLLTGLIPDPTATTITRVVLIAGVVVAAMGAWIWVAVRLSLGPVMTFVDREFRLFESWTFTRDHAWKLAGLMVVLAIIAFGIGLTLEGVILAIIYSQLGGFDPPHLHALFHDGQLPHIGPLLSVLGPVMVLVAALVGPMLTILVAPLASAYRDLRNA
ncbi:hypothetical protein DVT68_06870 [Dyella solisilvae]|uniref:Uncharacterized protein n=1 Tax=Dyella solisilvae TaxID=1920168 RepID=A0A370KDJ9_9GAMM|nr:hypothetical protein [Dyella solisilvae]RDJ00508.1 hypothetical protein DVT68_06870 [Dyella solisilvae]